jgi:hypothetical protein
MPWYKSVTSLGSVSIRDLHSFGLFSPRCVNPVETCTAWCNLHMYILPRALRALGMINPIATCTYTSVYNLYVYPYTMLFNTYHLLFLQNVVVWDQFPTVEKRCMYFLEFSLVPRPSLLFSVRTRLALFSWGENSMVRLKLGRHMLWSPFMLINIR